MIHTPTTVLLAIDPGVTHLGYAVLSGPPETVLISGTIIPRTKLSVLDRHLYLINKLQDLLTEWQPSVLAYEDFIWMSADNEQYVRGRPAMERLVGGVQALALWPPYPVLMPLLPSVWGRQLFGSASHTKEQIAETVNRRLGTTKYTGDRFGNHEADAVGIGIVALDTLRHQDYLHTHAL